jgi:acyl-CoA reductase-like NAD-dependent aldehyde dehydrogenase
VLFIVMLEAGGEDALENTIPVTLELGGKPPNILFADVRRRGR